MNRALYAASFHLMEASRHLSNIESFRPAGKELLEKANFLSSIIQTDTMEKMTEDRVKSVLDEIFSVTPENQ
jgi:hypothetical protein